MANEQERALDLTPHFPLSALVVEGNGGDPELYLRTLRKAHFEIRCEVVQTAEEFVEHLRSESYDVILCNYDLGAWTGLEALELLQRTAYDIPFILVTGGLGERAAVECFKAGVTDYVLKGDLDRLPTAVFHALEEKALRREKLQAERLLKANEAKFRALADAIPTAVFIEQGTQCCYVNRAAEQLTGFSRAELLQKNFWGMILPSSRQALLNLAANSSDDLGSSSRHRTQIMTKACGVRWMDVTVATIRLDGAPAALISAQDVTALQDSEKRNSNAEGAPRLNAEHSYRTSHARPGRARTYPLANRVAVRVEGRL